MLHGQRGEGVVYLCVFCITRDHEIEHATLSEYGPRGEGKYLTWSFEPDKFLDKTRIAVRPTDSYLPVTSDLKDKPVQEARHQTRIPWYRVNGTPKGE